MRRIQQCTILLSLVLAGPAAAQGASGVVTSYVDLYSGPDIGYPAVAQLPAGTPVAIQGCLDGWTWCDVITMGMRGWVAGTFVQYTYDNQPVIVADYGPRIGIPIIAFSIGVYWDHYYRDRPFYRDRDRWYSHPIAPRPPGWHGGDHDRPPPGPGRQPPPEARRPPGPGVQPVPSANYRPQPARPPENRPPVNRPENRPPSSTYRPAPSANRPPQPAEGHGQPVGRPPSGGSHPPVQEHRPPQGDNHGGQKPAPHPEPKKQDDNGH
ncbi:SH3 domain-containing protein [Dyella amyloliquefaciens]|uniref:SH3 domain-containing protein n=1 Tax=Dyella amyloliquefaciens TaxID=1770545 RepID=UPI00102E4E21|nr:SH3 domain-containing protein [Dyella amyloliquefaciens]